MRSSYKFSTLAVLVAGAFATMSSNAADVVIDAQGQDVKDQVVAAVTLFPRLLSQTVIPLP